MSRAAAFECAISTLLRESHLMPPDSITDAIVRHAGPMGVLDAVVYLVDMQQGWLRPIPAGSSARREPLAIDDTVAGRAFQQIATHYGETTEGRRRLWLPLLDGSARLGVLELVVEHDTEEDLRRYRALTSLVGLLVVSKSTYSDTFAQVHRIRPMELQAELAWAFMPPLSFATPDVLINVAIEPAYQVGGDAFDYALMDDRLHVSLFDASGHDLPAGMVAISALATCRNSRRAGATLEEIATRADNVIAGQFGSGRFATALLCDLDVSNGLFSWISCGHPPPLLIRGSAIEELAAPPRPPLGVAPLPPSESGHYVRQQQLQPRDRLLLYTDGVTEARSADHQEFGRQRLVDFVNQYAGEGIPAPEALRRLTRAILEHQSGELSDDATIMLLQWRPDRPDQYLF